tara:strand:- start:368 stop:715 length:348 start_codon:yes stop_codon:yes gene_type:complete
MNNIDKRLEGKSDGTEKKKLADLEGELFEVEQNLLDSLREDFEKEAPGGSFSDWLKSKPDDYFKRIELSNGGSTNGQSASEKYGDLIDAFEKGIDVMPGENLTQYIRRIKLSEKD